MKHGRPLAGRKVIAAMTRGAIVLLALGWTMCGSRPNASTPTAAAPAGASFSVAPVASPVQQIRQNADKLRAFVRTSWARSFLGAAAGLPPIPTRTLFHDPDKTHWFTQTEAASLPAERRAALVARKADEELYYIPPQYGDPPSYARPIELWAEASHASPEAPWTGLRVFDFGYGGIGHLRMLASLGVDATGVDPDPMIRALYGEASDQGTLGAGRLRLIAGLYPADDAVVRAVGSGYDLVISKNVLKRGYIHPSRPAPERYLIKLGVDDPRFLQAMHDALRPGGWMMIYNLSPAPAPAEQPFKPWSDGHCPFTEQQFQAAGLNVVVFDRDDTDSARKMAKVLGWDVGEEKMDLEHDLFAIYTLVQRPGE